MLVRVIVFVCITILLGPSSVVRSGEGDGTPNRCDRLRACRTWMYQIDGLHGKPALAALAETSYPLLVIDCGVNEKQAEESWARKVVDQLRTTPTGERRLLLAYIDIGQAEKYRDYWKKDWQPPTKTKPGSPDFLLAIDPDGWSGSYQTAFWDKRWQDIWLDAETGTVSKLARLGFDGIYLDWIDAYIDGQVIKAARQAGIEPAPAMIEFIERLGAAGRRTTPDFLVVAQNAIELIDADESRYVRAIDGLAVEDTWFYGKGGAKWTNPKGGDLSHTDEDPDWTPANRIALYEKYKKNNLPVFSVDYCVKEENAARVYREAQAAGLRPLVTRVSLAKVTETPPEKFLTP